MPWFVWSIHYRCVCAYVETKKQIPTLHIVKTMKCWRRVNKRLFIWQSVFLSLLHSSSFICFLAHWRRTLSPIAPVLIACWALCVWICVCDINPHHLRHQHTVLQLLPSLKGPVPYSSNEEPTEAFRDAKSASACWKEKGKKILFLCFALIEDALCVWLSRHPGFLPNPTSFLLPTPHPLLFGWCSDSSLALHTSLCFPAGVSPKWGKILTNMI